MTRGFGALKASLAALTAVAILGWCEGCAHQRSTPPDVVRAFADSVARGDWERGYGLMSEQYRRRVSFATFRAELDAERRLVGADAAGLMRSAQASSVRAVVETPGADRFDLVLNGADWRLDEQPLAPFGQLTPRAALRTLVRAIDLKRYDMVLKLVPGQHRPGVTEQSLRAYWEGSNAGAHRRLLEALRANLNSPIVDLGNEAFMPFGSSQGRDVDKATKNGEGEVHFILEDGRWKIDEVS